VNDYIQNAIRTEATLLPDLDSPTARLLHAAIGLGTESGEMLDAIKKHLFYGKPLDKVNLIEEMGDLCWYMAIAMDALGTNFHEVQKANIEKLKARFPDRFTEEQASNRNLELERHILENASYHQAVS
jgi:NTP pyrophosphatase (non-canonical NTP hydrolase)